MRWLYRLRLADDDTPDAVIAAAGAQFPQAGWEIRTRSNASPSLERSVERFTQYLTLVGLTALLIGGVGVANAVKGHLDRKREVIATMKALGATGGRVFAIFLAQVLAMAAIARDPGAGHRRRHAVRGCLGLWQHDPAADRAGTASRHSPAGAPLWPPYCACFRAVAARTRA